MPLGHRFQAHEITRELRAPSLHSTLFVFTVATNKRTYLFYLYFMPRYVLAWLDGCAVCLFDEFALVLGDGAVAAQSTAQ